MSSQKLKVRIKKARVVLPLEYQHARTSLVLPIVLMLILVGFLLLPVLLDNKPYFRLMMFLLVLGIVFFFLSTIPWRKAPSPGKVRLSPTSPLKFLPPTAIWILNLAGPICFLLAGTVVILSLFVLGIEPITGPIGRRGGGVFFIALGIAGIFYQMPKLLRPRGVELSPEGVRWWQGLRENIIPWDGLAEVALGAKKKGKRLRLHHRDGNVHSLVPMFFGSDPVVVAEVIRYFLDHPDDRETLSDPRAALALVADF